MPRGVPVWKILERVIPVKVTLSLVNQTMCRDRGAYTTAERAGMSANVDLYYTNSYGNYERDVYRDVRVEAKPVE